MVLNVENTLEFILKLLSFKGIYINFMLSTQGNECSVKFPLEFIFRSVTLGMLIKVQASTELAPFSFAVVRK